MIKTKIVETTEKYDKDGKLVEKITREETSEDDSVYTSSVPWTIPYVQPWHETGRPLEPYYSASINDPVTKTVN